MDNKSLSIFALAAHGDGISGSDRIFIELAKRLSKKIKVKIFVTEEGLKMCQKNNLFSSENLKFEIVKVNAFNSLGFGIKYLATIIKAIAQGFSLKVPSENIYSASEFWMDSLPCVILKMRFPKTNWIASWFQTAPNPLKGFTEGQRVEKHYLKAWIYYLIQLPVKPLIKKYADEILVNNQQEKKQFPNKETSVFLGAVNLEEINIYKKKFSNLEKKYDGVFQGRFHPQKGILELIDIWKLVVSQKNDAKLALIGDGPLMDQVKKKIKENGLEKNIEVFGYLFDGAEKYQIFAQSKVVLHPAFYDSGGMASMEAMAFGLPCIGFNLKAYESYYAKGMIKVPVNNLESFAKEFLELLDNKTYYQKTAKEALELISKDFSWEKRAEDFYNLLK